MKNLFKSLLIISCIIFSNTSVSAYTFPITSSEIVYQEDGSYFVTEIIYSSVSTYSTSTISGTKHSSYYSSSGKLLWKLSVTGTFSYTGSSSTCTASQCSVSNIASNWSVVSKSASKSKNTASASATMHQSGGGNVSKTVKLSCSSTGNLS